MWLLEKVAADSGRVIGVDAIHPSGNQGWVVGVSSPGVDRKTGVVTLSYVVRRDDVTQRHDSVSPKLPGH
jgi:hypothetical protein